MVISMRFTFETEIASRMHKSIIVRNLVFNLFLWIVARLLEPFMVWPAVAEGRGRID